MSIVTDLLAKPGVVAAGEYAYRGDRFSYRGALSENHARMASIMCRATTMSVNMEASMVEALQPLSGLLPARGWLVHGPESVSYTHLDVYKRQQSCLPSGSPAASRAPRPLANR